MGLQDWQAWQAIAAWIQAAILAVTTYIIWRYTDETKRLRKEAQRQTEFQQPFVLFEATRDHLQVRNIGKFVALNIEVEKFTVSPNLRTTLAVDPIPSLIEGECRVVSYDVLVDGQIVDKDPDRVLKPIVRTFRQLDSQEFRPEMIIKFQDLQKQRYFVKETLSYGELTIVDFGILPDAS